MSALEDFDQDDAKTKDAERNSSNSVAYHTKLVGVTFEGRQDIIKMLQGGEQLQVRREADNKYDKNAVAVDVFIDIDSEGGDLVGEWYPIGYIAKDKNSDIAATLDAGNEVDISLSSLTGGDDKSYGVNVYVEYDKVPRQAKIAKAAEAIVEEELTPRQKLELAIEEFEASFTNTGVTKKYSSRLLGKSTDVVINEGHMSIPGYLSGSAFPKKFYKDFDEEGAIQGILDKHFKTEEHERAKKAILAMWGLNRDASTGYGTAIHAALQNFITYRQLGDKTKKVEVLKTKTKVGPNKALSRNPFLKKIVEDFWSLFGSDHARLSEQFVWLHDQELAGSIDLVKVIDAEKKIIRIQDFKTDGDIHEKTYQSTDSPFYKLTQGTSPKMGKELLDLHWLQLSFYAYILKHYGYTVEGLDVYWLNPDKLCKGENAWEEFSHDVIDIEKGL